MAVAASAPMPATGTTETIPAELRQRSQWVLWRYEDRDGKATKVPYQADGRRASATEPATWMSFEQAQECGEGRFGFVVTAGDPYVGVDIDGCISEDGELHPDAKRIVTELASYTELTPSRRGLRCWIRAELNGSRRRTGKTPWGDSFEVYDRDRYFTVTGDRIAGQAIEERQAELDGLLGSMFAVASSSENGLPSAPDPLPTAAGIHDDDLLRLAAGFRTGAEFERLWGGDHSAYPSPSEARLALVNHLAFLTGPDPGRIDRLFRRSGLMVEKWERLGPSEIAKALEGRTDFYRPPLTAHPRIAVSQPTAVSAALDEARVDLVERIRKGIPEREYVPGGEEWLLKGKRYLVFAPAGIGKSLAVLVQAVETVAHGGRVSILDMENGADEYARRLEAILGDREELARACSTRLRYFEYPALALDWPDETWVAAFEGDDFVVIDSSRVALSSVGLSEDVNDDYALFVNRLITPLSRAGTATVVLDNSGHEGGHPRGASAKSDLNEVVYELRVAQRFDQAEAGELVWRCKRQRFGGVPPGMSQRLGGGTYEPPRPSEEQAAADGFRPTVLMEKVSRYIEAFPGRNQRAIREAGLGKRTETVIQALRILVDEGFVEEAREGTSNIYRSLDPYRRAEDQTGHEVADWGEE